MHRPPTCPYCGQPTRLTTAAILYAGRELTVSASTPFWHCEPCGAWVGCHPPDDIGNEDGYRPLGTPANAELRLKRQAAHRAFDPIWKAGRRERRGAERFAAYAWLAGRMRMSLDECHIAKFDLEECDRVIQLSAERMDRERARRQQHRDQRRSA